MEAKVNIALFCSGSGSNAQQIMAYFEGHPTIRVACLLANNPQAFALERAKRFNIPTFVFNREAFYKSDNVVEYLKSQKVSLLVLAGFLWLVPQNLLDNFPEAIINIHPALLPKYGGKGMYGIHVHKAVKDAGDSESGITIHLIDEKFDEGRTLFQASCPIPPDASPEVIAACVLALEHKHFAPTIEAYAEEHFLTK